MGDDPLQQSLLRLTGFLNRPQADAALLRRAGSSLDRALFPLLIRAEAHGGMTVGALADTVGRHYTTVSRQLTVLEQLGLVRREADPVDRRHTVVRVTDKGRDEARRIAVARNEGMAAMFADWSAADKVALTRLVTKLASSMEAVIAPGDSPRTPQDRKQVAP
jgi:DNA-binding MarR family transcriptional regulator